MAPNPSTTWKHIGQVAVKPCNWHETSVDVSFSAKWHPHSTQTPFPSAARRARSSTEVSSRQYLTATVSWGAPSIRLNLAKAPRRRSCWGVSGSGWRCCPSGTSTWTGITGRSRRGVEKVTCDREKKFVLDQNRFSILMFLRECFLGGPIVHNYCHIV